MITSISVQNLGCYDDNLYTANFDRLTVLVGANNSGKSTLFKGLNLVRHLAFSGGALNWNLQDYYSLQGFNDSVYSHDVTRQIRILTQYQLENDQFNSRFAFQGNAITENIFEQNGRDTGIQLASTQHKDIASTVWYVAPNRMVIPYQMRIGQPEDPMQQPINPTGKNLIDFLVQRYTSRDPRWDFAEGWLKRVDTQMTLLKTPISGNVASTVTSRNDSSSEVDVNINLQGSGIQNAATIVAAVVFSPENSTIIIEEPENFLNYGSVESLLDMFNDVINRHSKQIIISTHSWDVITHYTNDVNNAYVGRADHIKTDPNTFRLLTFNQDLSQNKIQEYDLIGKNSYTAMDELSTLMIPQRFVT